MKDNLKPCPFCGSNKVEKIERTGWGVGTLVRTRIECKNCGIKTRIFYNYEKDTAEEYWNRRANNG